MFAARRLTTAAPRALGQKAALFHSTAPAFVQKGDAIPDLDVLVENSPGNKVNLAKELKGKGVIIGVPAAFSMYTPKSELELLEDFEDGAV
jgi:2-Cys peroxiredoxin 5